MMATLSSTSLYRPLLGWQHSCLLLGLMGFCNIGNPDLQALGWPWTATQRVSSLLRAVIAVDGNSLSPSHLLSFHFQF